MDRDLFAPLFAQDLPDDDAAIYKTWWDWWVDQITSVNEPAEAPDDFDDDALYDAIEAVIEEDGYAAVSTFLDTLSHVYTQLEARGEIEPGVARSLPGNINDVCRADVGIYELCRVEKAHIRGNIVEETATRYRACWADWLAYCDRSKTVCMVQPSVKDWAGFLQERINRNAPIRGYDSAIRHCYGLAAELLSVPTVTGADGPILSIGDMYANQHLLRRDAPDGPDEEDTTRAESAAQHEVRTSQGRKPSMNELITARWLKREIPRSQLEAGDIFQDARGRTWVKLRSCLMEVDPLGDPTGRVVVLGFIQQQRVLDIEKMGGWASLTAISQRVLAYVKESADQAQELCATRDNGNDIAMRYALGEAAAARTPEAKYDVGKSGYWPSGLAIDALAILAGYPTFEAMIVAMEGRTEDVYATLADCFITAQHALLEEQDNDDE